MKKNPGTIKIMGQEKKDGYGQLSCVFNVASNIDCAENQFFTITKGQNGNYKTVFKSECRRKQTQKGAKFKLEWNQVVTDTDTLGNTDDNCEVRF